MRSYKSILFFILLLFLVTPVKVCLSQTPVTEQVQADESDQADKKPEKKKKIFELNEKFFGSLAINLVAVALIIGLIYYPNYRKMETVFTFIIFNLVIFLLTFTLKYVKLSMGAVFGLFAVFSILRYRTAGISMRDMTYMFIFIAMGLIGAIQLEFYELAIIDGLILLGVLLLDGNFFIRREHCRNILYENIEMIRPEHSEALMEDLKARTGLTIHRFTISRIDFLKDSARIRAYYYEKKNGKKKS
jgi:hypothetical protein